MRCPSGVTMIRQRAVPGPAVAAGVSKRTPDRGDVVAKHLAQQIVAHLADIAAAAAERGDPGHGVAGRAARALDRRPHLPIERFGALGIDQGHRARGEVLLGEKPLVGMRDHVDDRIADADDIDDGRIHPRTPHWSGTRAAEYRGIPRGYKTARLVASTGDFLLTPR